MPLVSREPGRRGVKHFTGRFRKNGQLEGALADTRRIARALPRQKPPTVSVSRRSMGRVASRRQYRRRCSFWRSCRQFVRSRFQLRGRSLRLSPGRRPLDRASETIRQCYRARSCRVVGPVDELAIAALADAGAQALRARALRPAPMADGTAWIGPREPALLQPAHQLSTHQVSNVLLFHHSTS
jgi:hypothetical protein